MGDGGGPIQLVFVSGLLPCLFQSEISTSTNRLETLHSGKHPKRFLHYCNFQKNHCLSVDDLHLEDIYNLVV